MSSFPVGRTIAVVTMVGAFGTVLAASAPPPDDKKPALERVEITGVSGADDRQTANAAKFTVRREDIDKFGDARLVDVLNRVPGVMVSGNAGQAKEISLRGMGGGYTQLLLNGEPVPAGFSLDSISPSLIERVEVIRSATADTSTQSIAGTINIVLRQVVTPQQRTVKTGAHVIGGKYSGTLTALQSGRLDSMSYSLAADLGLERNEWPSTTSLVVRDADGQAVTARRTRSVEQGRTLTVGLTPRLSWKPADANLVTLEGLLQASRFTYDGQEQRAVELGAGPVFPSDVMRIVNDAVQARAIATFKAPLGQDARIEAKLSGSLLRRDSDGRLRGYEEDDTELLFRTVDSTLEDRSLSSSGKYSLDLGDNHTLGIGWDAQYGRRSENRLQRESSQVGYPTQDLDEGYDATVTRTALYAQDEWAVSQALSLYLGLRWEALRTRTDGDTLTAVKNDSSVVSPTVQVRWKVPDTSNDQVRLSVGRTYKAPTARDLIPRRWVVNDNTPTSPNFQGNPALRPELAWGVDLGYERHLPKSAFLGLNLYARHIRNVVLQQEFLDGNTWVSTPTNSGIAKVFGLESELKGNTAKILGAGLNLDVRASVSRNWSTIEQIPAPGNRLKDQPMASFSLGVDHKLSGAPLTVGGNFAFDRFAPSRVSRTQTAEKSDRRQLDVYGRWAVSKTMRVNVSLVNLLASDGVVRSGYEGAGFSQEQVVRSPSFRRLQIVIDMNV